VVPLLSPRDPVLVEVYSELPVGSYGTAYQDSSFDFASDFPSSMIQDTFDSLPGKRPSNFQ
jgi:hypothetical protein